MREPLMLRYDEPFLVLSRKEKTLTIDLYGRHKIIPIDSLKLTSERPWPSTRFIYSTAKIRKLGIVPSSGQPLSHFAQLRVR